MYLVFRQSYSTKELDNSSCSQTGLNHSVVGMILYIFMLLTMIGLQIVILLLVICYYFFLYRQDIERDTPDMSMGWNPFRDAPQSLYAFIIAWACGFAWVLFYKRPQSLSAIFMRRSTLADATVVGVFIPDSRGVDILVRDGLEWNVTRVFKTFHSQFDGLLAFLYSEPEHSEPGQTAYCPVKVDTAGVRHFEFQMRRYNYVAETKSFQPAELFITGKAEDLLMLKNGLTDEEAKNRVGAIGGNVIGIEEPSIARTLMREFSRIFYVYQNFMTWSWINYSYWHMGIVNTLVYSVGGLTVSYINYTNAVRLQKLCKIDGTVEVRRGGKFVKIDQAELVPGEVVLVKAGLVYCDMVILTGETVVDESSLTGESMPIVKVSLDTNNQYEYDPIHHHKHNTIFAGTTVVSQDEESDGSNKSDKNLALVLKTGSYTMKGEMLREMFHGLPKKFKFDLEVNVVLLILLCYAIFSFAMTIYFLKEQATYGFFFAIYVVASALPPLLPTVFIVSEGISAERLLRKRVAVTDPHRILMAGKVRVAFFDKTGTLTEQGLDFHSCVTATSGKVFDKPSSQPSGDIARGMSVCHSLKKIRKDGKDTFLGNLIDRKMFEVTGSDLIAGNGVNRDVVVNSSGEKFAIISQYDFDHKKKTQSVIIRDESNGDYWVFTKGTGEALKSICDPISIPGNFDSEVSASAKSGIYQISIGFKKVDAETVTKPRGEVESGLTFLGFINFTNPMKIQTPGVIEALKEGDIRTVMISGDHILTALYISRLSGMIHNDSRIVLGMKLSQSGEVDWTDEATGEPMLLDLYSLSQRDSNIELALLGSVWDELWEKNKEKATLIAHFVRVIGRCSPQTKITIVDCFNREGFITMMCGDGGNDCGALKTAHVGIALSDAEASVVSPFTSLDKSITSVIDVLKEGRCTLASAFSSYKFMIMYGQIETINQMVCAWFGVTFSEWCWVFMDGFWVITLAFSLPFADVADKLAPHRPTSSILGVHTLSSSLGILLINFLFLVLALGILNQQEFYSCRKWGVGNSIADVTAIGDNYESSVIFLVSGYQYITSAMAFNFGFKHRAGWLKNWRFVFFVVVWTVIHFTIILDASSLSCFFRVNCQNRDVLRGATRADVTPIQNPWGHTVMPVDFRHSLFILVIMNGVANMLWEYFIVNGFVADWLRNKFPKKDRLLGGIGYVGTTSSTAVVGYVAVATEEIAAVPERERRVITGDSSSKKSYEPLQVVVGEEIEV